MPASKKSLLILNWNLFYLRICYTFCFVWLYCGGHWAVASSGQPLKDYWFVCATPDQHSVIMTLGSAHLVKFQHFFNSVKDDNNNWIFRADDFHDFLEYINLVIYTIQNRADLRDHLSSLLILRDILYSVSDSVYAKRLAL